MHYRLHNAFMIMYIVMKCATSRGSQGIAYKLQVLVLDVSYAVVI